MTLEEAIAIVKEEAAFGRHLAETDGENVGGDFASWCNRKAEAQEMLVACVEKLPKTDEPDSRNVTKLGGEFQNWENVRGEG